MRKLGIKDQILKYLLDQPNQSDSVSTIAQNLKIDYNLCVVLCDDIITRQLVDHVKIATVQQGQKKDKSLTLTPNGMQFIADGGYKSFYRKELLNKIGTFILPILAF